MHSRTNQVQIEVVQTPHHAATTEEAPMLASQKSRIDLTLNEKNPRFKSDVDKANILSKLMFAFGINLSLKSRIRGKGNAKLSTEDMLTIPWSERPDVLSDKISHHLEDRKRNQPKKGINLMLAVIKATKWALFKVISIETIFVFVKVFSAWVLKKMIDAYLKPDSSAEAYHWAVVITACLIVGFFAEHHWNFIAAYYPPFVQNALIDIIYGKMSRLSTYSLTKLSPGMLLNLSTNSLNFLDNYGVFLPTSVVAIAAIISAGAVLWQFFGHHCLVGLGYIVFWFPLQELAIVSSSKARDATNELTDNRIKLTSETLEGIRLLKMYTWEIHFKEKIAALRKQEMNLLTQGTVGQSISRAFSFGVQSCATFLTLLSYYYSGNSLSVGAVFAGYFLFGFLRLYPSYFFAGALVFINEAKNVFAGIEKVLETPELGEIHFENPRNSENAVEFENFTASWEKNQQGQKPVLQDITLDLKKGSLNALVGIVGSSKTSFLMSFTGEMPETTGSLRYKGKIAYVEQEPTIFAGTFKENILFGKPYDEEHYQKVIKACHLLNDLKLFVNGDQSMIGEKGNNLSGGQKARLALARAVYANADIYLLDDPLSAVDPKVARGLYENAIEGVLKGKTIILVTHQVDFVKSCENIIVIENGKVLGTGTLEDLKRKNIDAEKIFGEGLKNSKTQNDESHSELKHEPQLTNAPSLPEPELSGHASTKKKSEVHKTTTVKTPLPVNTKLDVEDYDAINTEKYSGRVTLKTYVNFAKEMGGLKVIVLWVILFILSQFGFIAFGRFLGAWLAGTYPVWKIMTTLGSLVFFDILIYNCIFLTLGLSTLKAARKLHEKMLDRIINATVLFFDINPLGQVVSRFSSDMGIIDRFIPLGITDALNITSFFASIIITTGIIDPVLLAPLLSSVAVAFVIFWFVFPSVQETKLCEMREKDPVFSLFSATLSGGVIMRMFDQTDNFRRQFRDLLHKSTKGNYGFALTTRVAAFYSDMAYTLALIGCVYIITAHSSVGGSKAVYAAFTLAMVLGLTGLFQYGLRQFSTMNITMSSVARIQEFCEAPLEPSLTRESDKQLKNQGWPKNGEINMHKVYMKYRPDADYVIRDLNIDVQHGEKIGCVGRTGAGKSTIVQLLYRMREIDRKGKGTSESMIKMDQVNTQELGLQLLRSNIAMIPQTPYLFSATIRANIDPLGIYTDEQVWNVLGDVRLRKHVENQPQKLNTIINNGSSVFSVGQKQLVCLARVALKPAPILIMDEATANMDHETDNFLQEKVMERFSNSTMFTIAHRLSTIASYDRVLVLSKGRKVEFDEPYKLLVKNIGDDYLTNTEGHFSIMVQNTGPISAKEIFKIAKNAYFEKHK